MSFYWEISITQSWYWMNEMSIYSIQLFPCRLQITIVTVLVSNLKMANASFSTTSAKFFFKSSLLKDSTALITWAPDYFSCGGQKIVSTSGIFAYPPCLLCFFIQATDFCVSVAWVPAAVCCSFENSCKKFKIYIKRLNRFK